MKLRKQINKDELRSLCIRKDWYTCGDCEEYSYLFSKCNGNMTDEDVVKVAEDIYDHSDIERFVAEYGVAEVDVFNNMVFEVFEITHTFVAE